MRRLTTLQSPVFLINSRLDLFTATPWRLGREVLHAGGYPFSRSYGVIMPSSLTMVLPIASVCSTCPPVSVLVRAPHGLPRGFSRKCGVTDFAHSLRLASRAYMQRVLHYAAPYMLSRVRPETRSAILLRHPIGGNAHVVVRECPPVVHRLRLTASP